MESTKRENQEIKLEEVPPLTKDGTSDLKADLETVTKAREADAVKLSLMETQVSVLSGLLQRSVQEAEQKHFVALKNFKVQLSSKNEKLAALSAERVTQEEQVTQLIEQFANARKENEFLTNQVNEYAQQLRNGCGKIARLEANLATGVKVTEEDAAKISLLEKQVANLTNDLQQMKQEVEKNNCEALKALQDKQVQLPSRDKNLQELAAEHAQLRSEFALTSKENNVLTSQVKESAQLLRESCEKTSCLEAELLSVTKAGEAAAAKVLLLEDQVTVLTKDFDNAKQEAENALKDLKAQLACQEKKAKKAEKLRCDHLVKSLSCQIKSVESANSWLHEQQSQLNWKLWQAHSWRMAFWRDLCNVRSKYLPTFILLLPTI